MKSIPSYIKKSVQFHRRCNPSESFPQRGQHRQPGPIAEGPSRQPGLRSCTPAEGELAEGEQPVIHQDDPEELQRTGSAHREEPVQRLRTCPVAGLPLQHPGLDQRNQYYELRRK